MAKFKPGDKVIISKDSKNIWIQGKKATVIRFLEEDNVPGSFYPWTYEVNLEDGDKCYVPQWEMMLEEGAKHHCIFEITQPNIYSELYILKFRNFGKKSISELNDFIKDHDLTWGMNV